MKTKQKILNAALTVLMEGGFKALTQTRVADKAGLSQGHLTYHFPTRSQLLTAVVDETKTRMEKELATIPKDTLSLHKLEQILIRVVLSKTFPRLMLALTIAADEEPTLANWFVESDSNTRQKLSATLLKLGWQVDDNALHLLRATVIGATLMHLQQNTDASEQTARHIVHSALQTLIQNASPL